MSLDAKNVLRIAFAAVVVVCGSLSAMPAAAGEVIFEEDFENGADKWKPTDASAWEVKKTDKGSFLSLTKDSTYSPPHTVR